MKTRIIIISLLIIILGLHLLKKVTDGVVHEDIQKTVIKFKQQMDSLSEKQLESIYYILGYSFKSPLEEGKKWYEMGSHSSDKSLKRFDFWKKKNNKKSIELDNNNFYKNMSEFIEDNIYVNKNFDELLAESMKHFDVIKTLDGIHYTQYKLTMKYYKFISVLNKLVVYNYLTNKNSEQIKKYYLDLLKLVNNNEYTIITKMIHLASFKRLNNFVLKNNIFPVKEYTDQMKKSNTKEAHKKLLLADRANTYITFEEYFPWSKDYKNNKEFQEVFYNQNVLKKYPFFQRIYFNTLDMFVSHSTQFDKGYTKSIANIDDCFSNYSSCLEKFKNNKSFLQYIGVIDSLFVNSLIFGNLNKLNTSINNISKTDH